MLDLKLAPGFAEAPFSSRKECWVMEGWDVKVGRIVVAADVGLNNLRRLPDPKGDHGVPFGFDPQGRLLYYCDGSIRTLQLDNYQQQLVLRPPDIPFSMPPPSRRANSINAQVDEDDRDDDEEEEYEPQPPSFMWFSRLSPDKREIVARAHCEQTAVLVHKNLSTGAVASRQLSGFGGYLDLDWASRRLFEGHNEDGPIVSTLEGEQIAVLSKLKGQIRDGRFQPGGGHVLVWEHPYEQIPFLLWDLASGSSRELKAFGYHPTWFRNGSGFWFMKGNHELWRYDLASDTSEPLLQVNGVPWDNGTTGAWYHEPVLSPDERYMFVSITDMSHSGDLHSACVLDLVDRKIRRLPDTHYPKVIWTE